MGKAIFMLCALTAASCAWLLFRSYWQTRHRLLAWSTACFVGLAADNVLLVLDRLVFTDVDLSAWRLGLALVSLVLLLCGLILDNAS